MSLVCWIAHCLPSSDWQWWGGWGYATLECVMLACELFRNEDNQDPTDWGRTFYFLLICLQNLDRGPLPRRELLPEMTLYTWKTFLHGMGNICYQTFLFIFLNCLPPIWNTNTNPSPLVLCSRWFVSLNYLTAREVHIFYVAPVCTIFFSPVSLSCVNLILRPAKEPKSKVMHPYSFGIQCGTLHGWTLTTLGLLQLRYPGIS